MHSCVNCPNRKTFLALAASFTVHHKQCAARIEVCFAFITVQLHSPCRDSQESPISHRINLLFFPQSTMFWRVQPTSLVETSCLFRQLPRPRSGKLILRRFIYLGCLSYLTGKGSGYHVAFLTPAHTEYCCVQLGSDFLSLYCLKLPFGQLSVLCPRLGSRLS